VSQAPPRTFFDPVQFDAWQDGSLHDPLPLPGTVS
jgi:hypothetical protein